MFVNLKFISTGQIPIELAPLKALEVLGLEGNKLEGAIPSWLGGFPLLKELYLGNNAFEGELIARFLCVICNLYNLCSLEV